MEHFSNPSLKIQKGGLNNELEAILNKRSSLKLKLLSTNCDALYTSKTWINILTLQSCDGF